MKTIKTKIGKSYTKKQICEAIAYWKKQLKNMDESTKYYSGGGPSKNNNELNNTLAKPGTITLHGYDRINTKTGEIIVNQAVVDFFRYLAHKCDSNWIYTQIIVKNLNNKYETQLEDVNIFYADSEKKLDEMLDDAGSNG